MFTCTYVLAHACLHTAIYSTVYPVPRPAIQITDCIILSVSYTRAVINMSGMWGNGLFGCFSDIGTCKLQKLRKMSLAELVNFAIAN